MRGSRAEAAADAEFEAHRIGLIIDHREERLLLSSERREMPESAVISIMLECGCPTFGEILGHPSCRREIERAQTLERRVEYRIDDQIHRSYAAADDRPDLARVAGRLPIKGIKAELEVDTV